jgi:organic hydroperoxide reductase OsmC/OhrA
MQPMPHDYEATLERAGMAPAVIRAGARPAVAVGPPPEFGGDAGQWSPEHLLLSALNSCLMATFDAGAHAQGLRIDSYASTARARLARSDAGTGFTGFSLMVRVDCAAGQEERVHAALRRAKERCFVANALRAPVQLDMVVTGAPVWPTEEAVRA